jgi:flagellar basal-body rod modification protein FlgD
MSAATNSINSSGQSPAGAQTLSQANFLQLLVTQMSSQDPLNPESDTDFAAQLAQFSSLQATQTMTGNIQTIQATGLIGKTVAVTPTLGGNSVVGVVSSVQISSGTPQIIVNGQAYNLNQITGVTATPTTSTPATTAPTSTGSSNSSSRNTNNNSTQNS